MKAGSLNQRVTIKEKSISSDGAGGRVETWTARLTVWASVEPLSGRELLMAAAMGSETTVRVRMRYLPWVSPKHILTVEGHTYQINSVVDAALGHKELVLECKESK
jgi:SPP1 family predicted phage head-tail adaptor